jgi:hypothetical protein
VVQADTRPRMTPVPGTSRRGSPGGFLTRVRAFLKTHLGLRYRKVVAIPVLPKKAIEEHAQEQARFLDQELEPALQEARVSRRAVFFVDAAHFVWAPFLGCLWCLARLFVRSATGRKRYNTVTRTAT